MTIRELAYEERFGLFWSDRIGSVSRIATARAARHPKNGAAADKKCGP